MKQYIAKDIIIAEIKKRINEEIQSCATDNCFGYSQGCVDSMCNILSFIDTIDVKDVDLVQEIKNRIDSLSNLYCYMEDLFNGNEEEGVYPIPEKVTNELFEFAKHFFELGLNTQKGD